MGKKRKHLSHEEIWDDSALIDSWNEALEEYKLYHSIHAKGERVEDVIKDFDNSEAELNGLNGQLDTHEEEEGEELEDGEWADNSEMAMPVEPSTEATSTGQTGVSAELYGKNETVETTAECKAAPSTTMPVPAPFPAQLHDEALKNLMMSWYWSGYYTGFYQGQQQAKSGSTGNG